MSGRNMRGRCWRPSWTPSELRSAIRWSSEGMTCREIAAKLGRTEDAVQQKLARSKAVAHPEAAVQHIEAEREMARRTLAFELACARSERATAPLLRSWPSGLWP